MARLLGAETIA